MKTKKPVPGIRETMIAICIAIIFIIFKFNYDIDKQKNIIASKTLLDQVEIANQLIAVERNKSTDLSKLLSEEFEKNNNLLQTIKSLEARPEQIRYIVETNTVLKPSEPSVVFQVLPSEYLYKYDNGLVVARFKATETYEFNLYDLEIDTDIAISEKSTAVSVRGKSSYEDSWVELDTQVVAHSVSPERHRFVKPEFMLGVSFSTYPGAYGSGSVSFLHPGKSVDVLSPRVSLSNNDARVGIDVVSYRISNQLPVLNNTWLSVGPSINLKSEPSLDLTIGAKL